MIGVVGLGFVGLTTALGFAEKGFKVTAVDIDKNKVSVIRKGGVPFWEPRMKDMLVKHLNKVFIPTSDYKLMVSNCKIIFICVGTSETQDGSADLRYIYSAIDNIVESITDQKPRLIMIKSTVPPGTSEHLSEHLNEKFEHVSNIAVGSNPEFLREGHALDDFLNPDRIVIGLDAGKEWTETLEEIYVKFSTNIVFTDTRTAEFTKYLSNTLLSTLISFSNEMSLIARNIGGIDIRKSFELLHQDRRFTGSPASMISYIYPGCGYGGYCLPKDTKAIATLSESLNYPPILLRMNIAINNEIMGRLLEEVFASYPKKETKIGVLGLSFKPDSDDVRESPAEKCLKILNSRGYVNIYAYDPIATHNFMNQNKDLIVNYTKTAGEAISSADVVIIVTAWDEFKEALKSSNKKVFDFRYFV